MKLDKDFLAKVRGPINNVWNYIGHDSITCSQEMGERMTNEIAIEGCVDADRLTMQGFKEADDLLKEAFKEHGYTKVFKFLCKNIELY